MNNNWESARNHFDEKILPKLKLIGKEIGLRAEVGLQEARDVIKYYEMLHKSFDPMVLILLEDSISKYEKVISN